MDSIAARHVPELDGLRGVAIVSVLIQHQMTPLTSTGGFLGVDLFFVLSGFLITSLLLAEFGKTGSISWRNFYMRRLLRLGPALAVFLAATLLVAYRTQTIGLIRQLKLIAIALLYSTNWRMAFHWDLTPDPTMIAWSLSIEEQFYLVWPLVLFACLALKVRRRSIAGGLALAVLAILVHRYFLLESGADLSRLYYGTDTRADALLVGCIFGFLHLKNLALRTSIWMKVGGLCAAVALVVLILTVEFKDEFLYRGGFTGVAIICGVLIYSAANTPHRILSTALRFTPLVWLGQISYGLYLWHWLVLTSTSFYFLGRWESSARLALSVGIAATSFYFVEKPFNQLKTRFATRSNDSQTTSTKAMSEELGPPYATLAVER